MPEFHGVFVLQAFQEVPDRGASTCGHDPFQPLRIRQRRRRGDDFDGLAGIQTLPQRHQFFVDARGDGVRADVGVHGVRKIQRGGIARQREDVSFRREQINLVREQIHFYIFEEFQRRRFARLRIDQAFNPFARARLRGGGGFRRLVRPVRRYAAFGDLVHVFGADLDFDRSAKRPEQHRVQRLIAVGFRDGDEIAESRIERLVQRVDRTECVIALHRRLHDDAETVHVHDLRERFVFGAHLGVDAVWRFDAAGDAMLDVFGIEPRGQRVLDFAHHFAAVTDRALDTRRERAMTHRIQRAESKLPATRT